MPIKDFYASSESDIVTFCKNEIHFSASLVINNKIEDYNYANIGVDEEFRRIYFAFQNEFIPGSLRFFTRSQKTKRKAIAVGQLYKSYDWIKVMKTEKDAAKKQFVLKKLDEDSEDYPKYKFYITVGYTWSSNYNFPDIAKVPKEPGVYRLRKDGEVVRIGETNNLKKRLKEHYNDFADEIDSFEFEIIPNEEERKKEQARLFKLFKDSLGRLPKLNPISN